MEYHHPTVTEFVSQFEMGRDVGPEIVEQVYDQVLLSLNPSPELEQVNHLLFLAYFTFLFSCLTIKYCERISKEISCGQYFSPRSNKSKTKLIINQFKSDKGVSKY